MDVFQHHLLQKLPTFEGLEIPEEPTPRFWLEAFTASNQMATHGYFGGIMPDGFRVAESSRVFFTREGIPEGSKSDVMVIVIDRDSDPVLKAIDADLNERFGHVDDERALATFLTAYARQLLEPQEEVGDETWRSRWHAFCLRNRGQQVRLGWLVKNRFGPCLPMAMLLKFAADVRKLKLHLAQGVALLEWAEPHAWCAREEETLVAYDPARLAFGQPMQDHYQIDALP
jgi:hypothetical protein